MLLQFFERTATQSCGSPGELQLGQVFRENHNYRIPVFLDTVLSKNYSAVLSGENF